MRKARTIAAAVAAAALLVASTVHAGPVSYTGGTYEQDFNSLSWTPWGSIVPWVNGSTLSGWYASGATRLRSSKGGIVGEIPKSLFAYGTSRPEFALGSQLGDDLQTWQEPVHFGVQIVNDTGQPLTEFMLSYFGELWGQGYGLRREQLSFSYAVNVLAIDSAGYIGASQLNFLAPAQVTTVIGSGNLTENRTFVTATITDLDWLPGQNLWLRWTDVDDPGDYMNSALAIDDLEFSAQRVIPTVVFNEPSVIQPASVPEPNSAALAALSMLTLALVLLKASRQRC